MIKKQPVKERFSACAETDKEKRHKLLFYNISAQDCSGVPGGYGAGVGAYGAGTFVDQSLCGFMQIAADRFGESAAHQHHGDQSEQDQKSCTVEQKFFHRLPAFLQFILQV